MTPTTTIVRATAADSRRLTRLVRDSAAYRGRYAAMVADYRVGPSYIEAHEVHKAVRAGEDRALGFYSLLVDSAELDLAFVGDEAQGTGIGRRLLAHMLDRAASLGLDEVRVVSHPPAEEFYRRLGAVRVGTVPASRHVAWDRPELVFTVPGRVASGA
ncbi:GNAT family N-acetyltransferase [Streptomyces sp. BI20]|uniref:GNAT family N-acetyltransferase n=1 Tax=Streptomyces sp. BI20 TaxID=3403460 RepID=UPI003C725633